MNAKLHLGLVNIVYSIMTTFPSVAYREGVPYEDCTQCGKCTSGCPASRHLELKPRKIVLMVQNGMIDELLGSKAIWECTQCHQCMERCPRKVTPYDVIIQLQNKAIRNGYPYPKNLDILLNGVKRQGIVQEPQEIFDREFEPHNRKDLGLPTLKGPSNLAAFRASIETTLQW